LFFCCFVTHPHTTTPPCHMVPFIFLFFLFFRPLALGCFFLVFSRAFGFFWLFLFSFFCVFFLIFFLLFFFFFFLVLYFFSRCYFYRFLFFSFFLLSLLYFFVFLLFSSFIHLLLRRPAATFTARRRCPGALSRSAGWGCVAFSCGVFLVTYVVCWICLRSVEFWRRATGWF